MCQFCTISNIHILCIIILFLIFESCLTAASWSCCVISHFFMTHLSNSSGPNFGYSIRRDELFRPLCCTLCSWRLHYKSLYFSDIFLIGLCPVSCFEFILSRFLFLPKQFFLKVFSDYFLGIFFQRWFYASYWHNFSFGFVPVILVPPPLVVAQHNELLIQVKHGISSLVYYDYWVSSNVESIYKFLPFLSVLHCIPIPALMSIFDLSL